MKTDFTMVRYDPIRSDWPLPRKGPLDRRDRGCNQTHDLLSQHRIGACHRRPTFQFQSGIIQRSKKVKGNTRSRIACSSASAWLLTASYSETRSVGTLRRWWGDNLI